MPKLGSGGDLRGIKDDDVPTGSGGLGPLLPAGWYRMMVTGSDYKQTSAGDGMCLHLYLQCLERGEYQGIEKRDFLTLQHPNNDTERIARSKLKGLALAAGHPSPDYVQDSSELHNRPVMAKVDIQESKNPKYPGKQNRIAAYLSVDDYRQKESVGNGGSQPHDEAPAAAQTPDEIPF